MVAVALGGQAEVRQGQVKYREWIADYERWGFPLPPKGSKLYRISNSNDFVIVSPEGTPGDRYYYGTNVRGKQESGNKLEPFNSPEVLGDDWYVSSRLFGSGRQLCRLDQALAIGIQLLHLGELDIALKVLEKSSASGSGGINDPYGVRPEASVYIGSDGNMHESLEADIEVRIAYLALHDRLNRWGDDNISGAEVVKGVEKVLATGRIEFTEDLQEALAGLYASARARPRANSAVARDVEALVANSFPLMVPFVPESSPYEKQRAKIVGHGFEALPVLAEYVDDPRWTRTLQPQHNKWGSHFTTVADVALYAISEITDRNAGIPQDGTTTKEAVLKYYEAVKSGNERAYWDWVLAPKPDDDEYSHYSRRPGSPLYDKFARKYPDDAALRYLEIVQNEPKTSTYSFASTIAGLEKPLEFRLQLFAQAMKSPYLQHRRPAFDEIRKLKPEDVLPLLKEQFDQITGEPLSEDERNAISGMAKLSTSFRDKDLWASVSAALKKCDPATLAVLARSLKSTIGDHFSRNQDLTIKALIPHIDDARTLTAQQAEEVDGRFKTSPWITLGDFVILQIGSALLDLYDISHPKGDDSPYNWYSEQSKESIALLRKEIVGDLKEKGYLER